MGHEAQQRLVIVLLGLGLCTVLSIVLAVVSMAAHTQDKEGSTASSKLGKYRRRMLGRVGLPTLCLLLVVLLLGEWDGSRRWGGGAAENVRYMFPHTIAAASSSDGKLRALFAWVDQDYDQHVSLAELNRLNRAIGSSGVGAEEWSGITQRAGADVTGLNRQQFEPAFVGGDAEDTAAHIDDILHSIGLLEDEQQGRAVGQGQQAQGRANEDLIAMCPFCNGENCNDGAEHGLTGGTALIDGFCPAFCNTDGDCGFDPPDATTTSRRFNLSTSIDCRSCASVINAMASTLTDILEKARNEPPPTTVEIVADEKVSRMAVQEQEAWDALVEPTRRSVHDGGYTFNSSVIPVVVMAGTRAGYLKRLLDSLDTEERLCTNKASSPPSYCIVSFNQFHKEPVKIQPNASTRCAHCYTCLAGDPADGGQPLALLRRSPAATGGPPVWSCLHSCSVRGFCGAGGDYERLGTSCEDCGTYLYSHPPAVTNDRASHLTEEAEAARVERAQAKAAATAADSLPRLRESYELLQSVEQLQVYPIRVQPQAHGQGRQGHSYVKHVWFETMRRVWALLEPYDGEVVFLEDDLVVALDFYRALAETVNFKRIRGANVFAMGGWGGENLRDAKPERFSANCYRGFPTMGYGFNRTVWNAIASMEEQILDGHAGNAIYDDWSLAVSDALSHHPTLGSHLPPPNRTLLDPHCPKTNTECAQNCDDAIWQNHSSPDFDFGIDRNHPDWPAMQAVQPTLSRVYHIGKSSSIGTDGEREVAQDAPWYPHDLFGTLLPPLRWQRYRASNKTDERASTLGGDGVAWGAVAAHRVNHNHCGLPEPLCRVPPPPTDAWGNLLIS